MLDEMHCRLNHKAQRNY